MKAAPTHDAKGRWLQGNSGNPGGKPAGCKNKLCERFWRDFHAVWELEGRNVLERLVVEDPATFAKVAAMLVAKSGDEGGHGAAGVTVVNVITGVRGDR